MHVCPSCHSNPPPTFAPPADGATAIALLIYALPLYWRGRSALMQGSQGEITADYISSMRLLSNTSK